MNVSIYLAARQLGCSPSEAEIVAVLVEADSLKDAAAQLNVNYRSASNRLTRVKRRLGVKNMAAAIARLSSTP